MKLTPKESKAEVEPTEFKGPEFPFGLSVRLQEEEIQKLGMTDLPEVGSEWALLAVVKVESVRSSEQADGKKSRSIEYQITRMGFEKKTNIDQAANKLYGGKSGDSKSA